VTGALHDLANARRALDAGAVSAVELATHVLHEAGREPYGALLAVDPEAASAPAAGPLSGIPIVVKDNIHVRNLPNTAGTRALAGFVPQTDAPLVSRLRAAGATIVAKAAMHELSLGTTGIHHGFGTVRNATDPTRMAGGSSSGVGAAVALGAPAGIGTDTGGSVRIPAALNGVVGFRPSTGRYPSADITPLSTSRDTPGPITRSVRDAIVLDRLLAGAPGASARSVPARLRLGVLRTGPMDPYVEAAFSRALASLDRAGIELVAVERGDESADHRRLDAATALPEAHHSLRAYLARHRPALSLSELAAGVTNALVRETMRTSIVPVPDAGVEATHRAALAEVDALRHAERDCFARWTIDALVFPTTPLPAAPIVDDETVVLAGRRLSSFEAYTRLLVRGSLIGAPGLTIPIPVGAGELPVGLALDALPLDDEALLAAGMLVEDALAG